MILVAILLVPVCGGLAAWLSERLGRGAPRFISLAAFVIDFLLVAGLWLHAGRAASAGPWIASFRAAWHPLPAVSFYLAADGVSLVLLALAAFLGCMAAAASWNEITERTGFFHLCLSWTVAGVLGVFLAFDLFLFYFAWELMLVPMYFLIALWGHEDRFRAAVKFFIFTQVSGLFMLASILGLYFAHIFAGGAATFDYEALFFGTPLSPSAALLVQAGFLAAFLVKLPAVPLHTWLPDAHTQAPTAGSVVLAGLLLKTGAYGIIRFSVPLFRQAAGEPAFLLAILGVAGILYGAVLAFGQDDLKRLIAYTSVNHMGFVLLGVVLGSSIAFQGAMVQMVAHGLSTGALFIIAGALQERLRDRDMGRMGGLWAYAPRMGGASMFFALASMGLPGIGNFVGEFLVVLGAFQVSPALAAAASVGFVLSTAYSLRLMHRVFFGPAGQAPAVSDLSGRETAIMVLMILPLLWLGLAPRAFMDQVKGDGPGVHALYRGLPQTPGPPAGEGRARTSTAPAGGTGR